MRVIKLKKLMVGWFTATTFFVFIIILDSFGVILRYYEEDFYSNFTYPLEGDTSLWISQMKQGQTPSVQPIFSHNYSILIQANCTSSRSWHPENMSLVIIVKSSLDHFDRRAVIRQTWGNETRFNSLNIRTVFLLGKSETDQKLNVRVQHESQVSLDIVQGNFVDSYFNNTVKTMMGLRWATENCLGSSFYFFFDDDMYVSMLNMLKFLENPFKYPAFQEERENSGSMKSKTREFDLNALLEPRFFSGAVYNESPLRDRFSKWFINLEEYPYHMWPSFAPAGAYILSRNALEDLFYGSFFVKPLRFDDVYLGIIAKKLGIKPFDCKEIYVRSDRVPDYSRALAVHGFYDPKNLEIIWKLQMQAGNA